MHRGASQLCTTPEAMSQAADTLSVRHRDLPKAVQLSIVTAHAGPQPRDWVPRHKCIQIQGLAQAEPGGCGVQNANVGGYQARGFVEVLAASQSVVSKKWFQGTADAVRQYLWLFDNAVRDGVEDFLILSGTGAPSRLQAGPAMSSEH